MRIVRPEPELKEWEKAGWTREPKNGREWRQLRAGLPQPEPRDPNALPAFRCKKDRTHRTFRWDGDVRRCATCGPERQRNWYKKNKDKQKGYSKNSRAKRRKFKPTWEDGMCVISATWLSEHPVQAAELVNKGVVIVEIYGEAAYGLVSLEKAREAIRR